MEDESFNLILRNRLEGISGGKKCQPILQNELLFNVDMTMH